ncbi:MAG: DUF6807 family protein [Kiritimatiellia bacterium]
MKRLLLAIVACAVFGGFAAVPKIIFDTDMVEDYDDVGAMACLHALADEGRCEILAMATCTRDNQSVAAVEILNAFYGRPEIPVGCSKELGVIGVPNLVKHPNRPGHAKYVRLAKEYAEWVKHPNSNDAPDANEVYRKALAAAPDKSVVFCSVGFLTNMRRLLETKGDQYSPLSGRELVKRKVTAWYAMACKGPKGREYNSMHDAASSKIALEQWPTPIYFSDFDLGRNIYAGRVVAETDYAYRNPVKDVFQWSLPSREAVRTGKIEEKEEGGRMAWDEATVLAAVYGPERYFELERGIYRMVGDAGDDEWVADPKLRGGRLVPAVTRERRRYANHNVGAIINELIAREPKCRRTDEAIMIFRQSKLEQTATGVKMTRNGATLWNLELDTPEGRPFFHPLALPSGKTLTDLRPKDHFWHLGYWFSWKFINGVNYWEPADEGRQGAEPAGATRVVKKNVRTEGLDCVVDLKLEYGPRGEREPVLTEDRTITIDPPDPKGGYVITVRHTFTARADATLGRTPPHGDVAKGQWGGGYAGATLRLDSEAAKAFAVRGYAGGTTPAACTGAETTFLDLSDPASGEGVTFTQLKAPASGRFYIWPDKRMVNPSPVYTAPLKLAKGETLELAYKLAVHADRRPDVKGARAREGRVTERMDRGVVATVTERGTYVGWRMLETDAKDRAFDLWRKVEGKVEKVNAAPIVQTSDCFLPGYTNAAAQYSVDGTSFTAVRSVRTPDTPYISIPLADTNATIGAVAVGDLDGDGAYDFVVKTPSGGTDPWDLVWKPAEGTYKLEAYTSTGRFLWRREMGWNIELGIWYSPFVVVDLDGDGKAEVVAKTAPLTPDYRDRDGRVMAGPEFLTVFDGLTGEVRAQTPWIPRGAPDPVDDYNHFNSRNQLAVAYLDGRTPCVIMERGTYGKMIVDAYAFNGTALERVWRFNNEFMPRRFRGQGDHGCLCNDVDGDGCDEVLIGSLTLDHDGTVLWCNGHGHSDAHYYGDIDPKRPGMELAFIYETRQPKGGGIFMANPVTGEEIWKLPTPTRHVHGCGICADLDPAHPGLEVYGQEVDQSGSTKQHTHPQSDNRWFYAADGTLLAAYTNCTFRYGNGVRNAFWDADLQREVYQAGGMRDHAGTLVARVPGCSMVADLFGDWREEIVVARRGEVRIYTTDIPAMDRRVTLMRDPSYRSRITMWTSGYDQQPIPLTIPSALSPGLSLRVAPNGRTLTLDVNAPLDAPLKGELEVTEMPKDWSVNLGKVQIDLPAGGHWTKTLSIKRPPYPKGRYDATATLRRAGAPALVVHQPFCFF